MGHEIPAALGIRLHDGPGAEIFVVIGDGTFLMAPTELVTAVQEDLKLTVVVLDNGGYRSIDALPRARPASASATAFGAAPTAMPVAGRRLRRQRPRASAAVASRGRRPLAWRKR